MSLTRSVSRQQRQLARTGRLAAADEYGGIADAFSRISRDGDPNAGGAITRRSIAALYTGLTTESAKSVLDSFLFFLFYEFFRSRSRFHSGRGAGAGTARRGGAALRVLEELAIGVAAGACSRALTTPIANVVTRKQTGAMVEGDAGAEQLSVREIVNNIMEEKGIKGLWSGYSATLVLTLNPSITFFLQEFLKRSLLDTDEPGPAPTFLLAATSKAIASTITYPFQIAKSRLQAGVPVESEPASRDETEKEKDPNVEPAELDSDDNESVATERAIDREVDTKLRAARAVQKFAQQSIFGTIAQIVRTEGLGSLYDGVHGEVLKGFCNHGTTMLAKDMMHKLLFKLYLVIAGLLRELRLRRQQRVAQARRRGEDVPRALSFTNLEAHGKAAVHDSRTKVAGLLARLLSFGKRDDNRNRGNQSSPGIILNFQDRSQRDLGKD
ncbi:hypothetical protein JX265_009247 [Neoarthrinium moseri]|uniref:Peroxisomal adenine nucleotide transporter 1 n=1 Tax=Neoarthrinium moseri TaxID=1658444 RepID=A0A9Q0ALJ3_9PEZI|nr:hypothetical protein JX265_009247 [Neoarthrinium moseri]